jgi:zinc finger protein
MSENFDVEILEGEMCPFCRKNTLTLRDAEREIPYFGKIAIFSMSCENEECGYHKADVESLEKKPPMKCTFKITSEEDLNVRVVKSSNATITIPRIGSIEPGDASNGYITSIEGIINRIKKQIENIRDLAEENEDRKKAKNLLKKLNKALMGQEELTINLQDPTGNSAIISDKTIKK